MPKVPRLSAADAEAMLLKAGFNWLRSRGSHRSIQRAAAGSLFRFMPMRRCTRRSSNTYSTPSMMSLVKCFWGGNFLK